MVTEFPSHGRSGLSTGVVIDLQRRVQPRLRVGHALDQVVVDEELFGRADVDKGHLSLLQQEVGDRSSVPRPAAPFVRHTRRGR